MYIVSIAESLVVRELKTFLFNDQVHITLSAYILKDNSIKIKTP